MTTTAAEFTELLHSYQEAGIKMLRVHRETKKPVGKNWQHNEASFDEVARWVRGGNPLGWQMGEVSDWLGAVDCDCTEAEALAPIFLPDTLKIAKGNHAPSLYIYRSAGFGFAKFYDPDPHVTKEDKRKTLIDVKASANGKGHHICVPPAVHAEKGPYRFLGGFDPKHITEVDKDELQQMVGELVVATAIARHLPAKGRHDLAMALAGYMLRRDVEPETIAKILHAAWRYHNAPSEAHTDIDGIIRGTDSNLKSNERVTGGPTVGEMLGDRFTGLINKALRIDEARLNVGKEAKKSKKAKKSDEDKPPTHDELRDRWMAANPDYVYGLEDWRKYEDGIWPVVKTPVVKESMVRVLEDAKEEGIRPSVFVLNSVHALAQTRTYIADEIWDNEPDIIVCENECIDTRSGDTVPHSRTHYATTRIPCAYNPDAKAPNWERFLEYLQSVTDADTVQFLKEFAGYTLTLDTSLEKALWLVGPPGGGKSTFIEGLKAVLANRAGTLGLREIERSRFSLSKIVGKSLVTSTEQPSGYVGCHDILNAIISGEELEIERKWKQPYDYVPKAKIVWSMNELPRVPSGAEGLFRRIEVVRFPKLAESEKDPELKEAIKGEAEGILAWAVEGLLVLKARGDFQIPEKVAEETEEFRANNDIPAAFVAEACYVGDGHKESSTPLYRAYRAWCLQRGYTPKAINTVTEDWKRLGFSRKKTPGGMFWLGVEVKGDFVAYE